MMVKYVDAWELFRDSVLVPRAGELMKQPVLDKISHFVPKRPLVSGLMEIMKSSSNAVEEKGLAENESF